MDKIKDMKKRIKTFIENAKEVELDAIECLIEGLLIERQRININEGSGNWIDGGMKKIGKESKNGK